MADLYRKRNLNLRLSKDKIVRLVSFSGRRLWLFFMRFPIRYKFDKRVIDLRL